MARWMIREQIIRDSHPDDPPLGRRRGHPGPLRLEEPPDRLIKLKNSRNLARTQIPQPLRLELPLKGHRPPFLQRDGLRPQQSEQLVRRNALTVRPPALQRLRTQLRGKAANAEFHPLAPFKAKGPAIR